MSLYFSSVGSSCVPDVPKEAFLHGEIIWNLQKYMNLCMEILQQLLKLVDIVNINKSRREHCRRVDHATVDFFG